MSWTTPRTWVTGETVTAALLNAHVRDNFRETSPFTVTTAGDLSYADAANSMNSRLAIGAAHGLLVSTGSAPVWRIPATDVDTSSKTDTNTSYSTLGAVHTWWFASEIEVTVTTGTLALVLFKARLSNGTANAITYLSYQVSGATTTAASDTHSISYRTAATSSWVEAAGFDMATLTAGSNTFTLAGKVSSGSGTIAQPEIAVLPL